MEEGQTCTKTKIFFSLKSKFSNLCSTPSSAWWAAPAPGAPGLSAGASPPPVSPDPLAFAAPDQSWSTQSQTVGMSATWPRCFSLQREKHLECLIFRYLCGTFVYLMRDCSMYWLFREIEMLSPTGIRILWKRKTMCGCGSWPWNPILTCVTFLHIKRRRWEFKACLPSIFVGLHLGIEAERRYRCFVKRILIPAKPLKNLCRIF